jgi:hypothetical protein
MELNASARNLNPAIIRSVEAMFPTLYQRATAWAIAGSAAAADRRTVTIGQGVTVAVGRLVLFYPPRILDLNVAANWDSATPDYTVAANRAGKDFFIHAVNTGTLLLSANSTVPVGYAADQARPIGGFHCVCLSIGAISAHPLTGFLTGDILPASIWDLAHRPVCSPAGMWYGASADLWVDIYLMSGTGASTASAYGATITDTRNWMDFADDLAAVGKRMLTDVEFQVAATGSNEETNIVGSTDPVTTGGHVDTAGRRMVSNGGGEDMCGVTQQWLAEQSYRNDDGTYSGTFSWYNLPGAKGSIYNQGALGDSKLLAGGSWSNGTNCGSRCRSANNARWLTHSSIGSRGCARRQG